MRKVLPILALLFLATACRAQIVQTALCTAKSTSAGAACTITVQPNQMLIVMGTVFAAYNTFDANGWWCSPGNFQYSEAFTDPNSTLFQITAGMSACVTGTHSGSDTFTVNPTQFAIGASIVVEQWSGLSNQFTGTGAAVVDSSVGNTSSGTGAISGGNFSTTATGDLLLAIGSAANNAQTLAVGAGYTQDENYNYIESAVNTYVTAAAEHQTAGAAGSYPANFTVSNTGPWAVVGIALSSVALTSPQVNRRQIY